MVKRIYNQLKASPTTLPAVLWISSIQYFLVQIYVASNFYPNYSLRQNTISDLGHTVCGPYGDKLVCSANFLAMNISFIILGLTMLFGALLNQKHSSTSKLSSFGFSGLALSGLGTVLIGIFPENSISSLHIIGAGIPFLVGNISLVILSRSLEVGKYFSIYTFLSGFTALIALALFLTQNYLGLGIGGIERIVAYPQTIWLISYGIHSLIVQRFK